MKIRSLPLLLLASTALGGTLAVPLSAQTPPVAPPAASPLPATPAPATTQPVPTQLDAVTTAATRTRRPLDDVPATVSVITTEDINRENMQDVRDLVRNEPGVTVGNNPFRAGFQNFLIRGIGGNRVLLMQDGMRMPDFPDSNMGAGTYTREQPDLEDIKRVEIIRGPASALYGSDAIDGVVGGERQRVQLARVLAQCDADPAVRPFLLLDEPIAGLDLAHQHAALADARRRTDRGLGVLAVLHDLNMAARYADRVAIVEKGRLTALGPTGTTLDPATLSAVFITPIVRVETAGLTAWLSPGPGLDRETVSNRT